MIDKGGLKLPFLIGSDINKYYFKMNRIIELSGLTGVKDEKVFAYQSTEPEKVRKALEIEIACTGADDNGAYNIMRKVKGDAAMPPYRGFGYNPVKKFINK